MNNLILRSIVGMLCVCLNSYADEKVNLDRQNEFQRFTLQRSWHYASLLIGAGSPEVQQEHARTMVTAVFHYWMMRKNNLIEEMATYEAQVRRTFKDKKLDHELLNDPLGRFTSGAPRYSLSGFNVSDEEYRKIVPKFKDFVLVQ